tara:strand:+ start:5332 stop:6066 length:735 start_codon:yes stop_codon:yes gene_type:complete
MKVTDIKYTTFFVITILFFLIKNKLVNKESDVLKDNNNGNTIFTPNVVSILVYVLSIYVIDTLIPLIENGLVMWGINSLYWLFFLLTIIVVNTIPGLTTAFSNTFGYIYCCYFSQSKTNSIINNFFNNIFKSENDKKEILKMIYTDRSLILNELNSENIKDFLQLMLGTSSNIENGKYDYIENISDNLKETIQKLENLIESKKEVAYFIWYILAGSVFISMSNTYYIKNKKDKPVKIEQEIIDQ